MTVGKGWPLRVGQRASRSRLISRRDIELALLLSRRHGAGEGDDAMTAAPDRQDVAPAVVSLAVLDAAVDDLQGVGGCWAALTLRFSEPVRPGDVITAVVEVVSTGLDDSRSELEVSITRDDGGVVLDGRAVCPSPGL